MIVLMYDWISCVLWVIEISIMIFGILCSLIATRNISTDTILHYNFRVILISIFVRNILGSAERMTVIISRAFIYGEGKLPYQNLIGAEQLFTSSQLGTTLIVISVERMVAISVDHYEERCRTLKERLIVPIILFTPATALLISYLIRGGSFSNGYETYYIYISYAISAVTSQIVYRISKGKLRNRHALRLQLNQKFASTENIRAMRIFLPCVCNELITFGILVGLMIYSMFFSPYPLGEDPTKISHAYDLLGAYRAAFMPSFIVYRYRSMRKQQIAAVNVSPTLTKEETDKYFMELENSWK